MSILRGYNKDYEEKVKNIIVYVIENLKDDKTNFISEKRNIGLHNIYLIKKGKLDKSQKTQYYDINFKYLIQEDVAFLEKYKVKIIEEINKLYFNLYNTEFIRTPKSFYLTDKDSNNLNDINCNNVSCKKIYKEYTLPKCEIECSNDKNCNAFQFNSSNQMCDILKLSKNHYNSESTPFAKSSQPKTNEKYKYYDFYKVNNYDFCYRKTNDGFWENSRQRNNGYYLQHKEIDGQYKKAYTSPWIKSLEDCKKKCSKKETCNMFMYGKWPDKESTLNPAYKHECYLMKIKNKNNIKNGIVMHGENWDKMTIYDRDDSCN
jgi:hypothetical protein